MSDTVSPRESKCSDVHCILGRGRSVSIEVYPFTPWRVGDLAFRTRLWWWHRVEGMVLDSGCGAAWMVWRGA